jgi:hypothetical protein
VDLGPTVEGVTETVPEPVVDEQADAAESPGVRRASDRSVPGSTDGAAGWVTLVGLVAVVALAAGDQLVMRRGRRRIPV